MITDEMLKEAAAKAADRINDSLPDPQECHHKFTEQFEKQMKRCIHQTNHPIRYKYSKYAACLILVCTIGFGSVLAVNIEAREAFLYWIRSCYEQFYMYTNENQNRNIDIQYELGWIPEGYEWIEQNTVHTNEVCTVYKRNDDVLVFHYFAPDGGSFMVEKEDILPYQITINGMNADIYLDPDQGNSNVIVLTDPKTDYLIYINGNVTEQELLKMAHSITSSTPKQK